MIRRTANHPSKFWLVWNEAGNVPMHKHSSYESAVAESERLAKRQRGTGFYVLEALERNVVREVVKERLTDEDDGAPF